MLLQSPTAPALVATRSLLGSDSPPDCHSIPQSRFATSRREPLTLEHPTLALCLLSVIGKTFFELRAASLPLGGRLTKQTTRLRVASNNCIAGRPIKSAPRASTVTFRFLPENEHPQFDRRRIFIRRVGAKVGRKVHLTFRPRQICHSRRG